jgi:signal transduction histidine kinase/ActR/RegA family two-component response regulator
VAVFIADQHGRITDVNPAVSHTWGRLPVLSASLEDFAEYYRSFRTKTGKPVPVTERGLYRAIRNGESVAAEEMEYLRGDGKRGSLLHYAEPIRDATGRIMGGVAVSVDITDLKRTQKQLLELNDALEQRVRDRTRSLVTYQEHLRAMTSELVLTEQRERRRLATELHDYLAQLLVASKMKSKLVSYHVQSSGDGVMKDLRDLIDEALKYTRTLIADLSPTILYEAGLFAAIHWLGEQMQRHNLVVRIEENGEPVDMPDDKAVMVFQTVRELLFNVVKHAKVPGATVRIEQLPTGELTVTVEDAGAGFDPSRQELHPAGGKFGLFSVRERLAALGGTFEIDSAPGRGTRAVVRVPLEPGPIDEDSAAPVTAPAVPSVVEIRRRGTIRVLLVDDHKMVREGFRTLIECDAQLEVAGEAANGEEAVELARLLHPDVVIMDINMPKMNGIEATRRIKQEMPHVSIIGLSVHDDRGLIASMLEAGASCYLTKGGQSEELSRAIHATYEAQVQERK